MLYHVYLAETFNKPGSTKSQACRIPGHYDFPPKKITLVNSNMCHDFRGVIYFTSHFGWVLPPEIRLRRKLQPLLQPLQGHGQKLLPPMESMVYFYWMMLDDRWACWDGWMMLGWEIMGDVEGFGHGSHLLSSPWDAVGNSFSWMPVAVQITVKHLTHILPIKYSHLDENSSVHLPQSFGKPYQFRKSEYQCTCVCVSSNSRC